METMPICRYAGCRQPAQPGQPWCAGHAGPQHHQRRPSRYPKRFCAHPGCRSYARRDGDYCASHDTPAKREGGLRRAPCPRCAHPGCRKHALRGERYCMHHHPDRPRPPRAANVNVGVGLAPTPRAPKIPCAQPGCRNWAMHDQPYCYGHRTPQRRASRPDPVHCAFPDCKNWAVVGQPYCRAHGTEERRRNALHRRQGRRSPPCAHRGCRKRAMLDQQWCRQHHPMGNADAAALQRQHGLYSKYFTLREFCQALEAAGVEGIKPELALARLVLLRAIEKYLQSPQRLADTLALANTVFRGVGHIAKLVQLDRLLDPILHQEKYQEKADERLMLETFNVNTLEELDAILDELDKTDRTAKQREDEEDAGS